MFHSPDRRAKLRKQSLHEKNKRHTANSGSLKIFAGLWKATRIPYAVFIGFILLKKRYALQRMEFAQLNTRYVLSKEVYE